MIPKLTGNRFIARLTMLCAAGLMWLGTAAPARPDQPPPTVADSPPAILSLNDAVAWALQNNPQIAAIRQQHGIAAAAVVIARTYPFNPVWTNKLFGDNGPESAGVTNRLSMEQRVSIDLEIRGQRKYRTQAACAALSRTDWEIAQQEISLAVRVIRAYAGVLYRQEKLDMVNEMIRVNEEAARQVEQLVKGGKLRPADLILIRTEVDDARAQLAVRRSALAPAWHEFRAALGIVDETLQLQGVPAGRLGEWEAATLVQTALARRPDFHARQAAAAEAEARVRLAVADRYGNPNIGPDYEYNETRVNFIGAQIVLPLPVLNTHRGEILQRQAERTRAYLDVRQTEVAVRQDVYAALVRNQQAREWLNTYRQAVVPGLQDSLKRMTQLFEAGDPGVDTLRLIDVRRRLLRARDAELDARWELLQALADLAAAVGDPSLVLDPGDFATRCPAGPPK
jgi:cobalt-zinc-cadmium efflux system outer membrane protein